LSEERRKGEEDLTAVDVKGVERVLEKGRVVRRGSWEVFWFGYVRCCMIEALWGSIDRGRTVRCHVGCRVILVLSVVVETGHARRAEEAAVNNCRIMWTVI
jgi:hypothetical protein